MFSSRLFQRRMPQVGLVFKIADPWQDNGFCQFSHVRIPRTNMAMRPLQSSCMIPWQRYVEYC